jgi:hypothetical protein
MELELSSSDDESEVEYHSAGEEFDDGDEPLLLSTSDFGVPREGEVVIGGRWKSLQELPAFGSRFNARGEPGVGWDQPDPKEVLPLSADEVRDSKRLIEAVGEQQWRSLPADLQLAFLRDVYGNPEGVGWKTADAFDNTVPVMQTCAKWAEQINAFRMHEGPALPREETFRECAPYAYTGEDAWGHPRIWATVTGWPPIGQELRQLFTAEEVSMLHTKRFLEFQQVHFKSACTQINPHRTHTLTRTRNLIVFKMED